ncbi:MAG: hypothetical protein V3W44_08320 [Dehalococcoidales bacterium]
MDMSHRVAATGAKRKWMAGLHNANTKATIHFACGSMAATRKIWRLGSIYRAIAE